MGLIYNIKYFRCGHIIYDLVSARIQAHVTSKRKICFSGQRLQQKHKP